jgi:hypothetical protein
MIGIVSAEDFITIFTNAKTAMLLPQTSQKSIFPYCAARLKYKAENQKPIIEQQCHGAGE